jgi:4-hydroxybenzoate polyprenyltransferase
LGFSLDRFRLQLRFLLTFFREVYLLEIFGALSVSALGWAACQCSGAPWQLSAPLWFAGYLVVYNSDRLYSDPADSINTPLRFRYRDRLRLKRLVLIVLGSVILIVWPLITHQSLLLPGLAAAALAFQFYSRPFPGAKIRLKDLPGIKCFFVPAFIATILVVWPILEAGERFSWFDAIIFAWCFLVLGINSLVFDLRDLAGDRLHGTPTIPARIGGRMTILLLAGLGVGMVSLSGFLGLPGDLPRTLPLTLAFIHLVIMAAIQCRARPMLLSFLADLLLLTPAFSIGIFH